MLSLEDLGLSASQVLILGGQGRIGRQVAADIAAHTRAEITITGRQPSGVPLPENLRFLALDLADQTALEQCIQAIAPYGRATPPAML